MKEALSGMVRDLADKAFVVLEPAQDNPFEVLGQHLQRWLGPNAARFFTLICWCLGCSGYFKTW